MLCDFSQIGYKGSNLFLITKRFHVFFAFLCCFFIITPRLPSHRASILDVNANEPPFPAVLLRGLKTRK